jgi:hypothetical protein
VTPLELPMAPSTELTPMCVPVRWQSRTVRSPDGVSRGDQRICGRLIYRVSALSNLSWESFYRHTQAWLRESGHRFVIRAPPSAAVTWQYWRPMTATT